MRSSSRRIQLAAASVALGAMLIGGGLDSATAAMPARHDPIQLAQRRGEPSPERIAALQDVVSNMDHSIDILNQERPDPHGYRHQAVVQVTKTRDAVQREIDEIEHHKRQKDRDTRENHRRDEEYKKTMPKEYYPGLQTVMLYLQHAQDHLERDPGDAEGHRHNALTFIKNAKHSVQHEMDDYLRKHPRQRH